MATFPLQGQGPKFRAFDANGDPLSGGKLYAYAAGTSTPLDTYTTRAGNIANTNPVILDANGEADVWTTDGVLYKFVLKNSADVTQWTVDNVPSGTQEGPDSTDIAVTTDPGLRLTLTSGVAVTTSDVSSATTVFYVPYKHHQVPLYDGSTWALHTVATELSQALSDTTKSPTAATNGNVYDLFVWNDSGTLRLSRGPAWSSTTARGTGTGTTELTSVGGRLSNKFAISNGPSAQRGLYVGTIFVTGSGVDDAMHRRHIWNAYHRVKRPMAATEPTASWTYAAPAYPGTDDFRQANDNGANQLQFVFGLPGEAVSAQVLGCTFGNSSLLGSVGIGLDSATVNSATHYANLALTGLSTNSRASVTAAYEGYPGLGLHSLKWLERPGAWIGTASYTVDYPSQNVQAGIWGHLFG